MGRAKKSVEVEAQVIARGNVVPMMTETESEETVQYVSDEDAAREDRLVSEIRMITEQTKQVVLFNSIEIGRRLTEAKAMVKRGTWGTWLKERVDYSQRTANNFMKIYQEYGRNGLAEKSQALANLSYTQALALIDLPEDERARFAEERKAGEMALRKLQEEVRQEKEKVTAVKELANRNAAEAEAKFADELKQKDTQMAKLTAEKAKVAAQIEVLEKRAAEAEKSNQNPDEPVKIEAHTWKILKSVVEEFVDPKGKTKNKVTSDTVGEFTQIPLKLAYAITIHKSQGLTFDRCTVHTKTFAAGQLYVGLSRCSNIEGLTIFPKMEKNRLHASREVIDFYARMEKKASEGTVQLECPQRFSEQVKAYIADLLEKEKAAEKQAAPACSSAGEALPWEREDAPGRDYQSTWNQF